MTASGALRTSTELCRPHSQLRKGNSESSELIHLVCRVPRPLCLLPRDCPLTIGLLHPLLGDHGGGGGQHHRAGGHCHQPVLVLKPNPQLTDLAFSFLQIDPFAPQRLWQLPHLLTCPCRSRPCLQQGSISHSSSS